MGKRPGTRRYAATPTPLFFTVWVIPMRIIGGSHAGLRLQPPTSLPVRPTTDMAKEALFNVLQHRIDFDGVDVLDLCAGTGNVTFEIASRGAGRITAVDIHFKCIQYINSTARKLDLVSVKGVRADVLKFIASCKDPFDFIFADPPDRKSTRLNSS